MMKKEIVTKLIVRSLLGVLPDEEQKLLDKWLAEDVSHRELYQRLNDRKYLASEYSRWESIDTARPCENMKMRIGRRRSSNSMYILGASFGVAAAITFAVILFRHEASASKEPLSSANYIESIQPGHTKAELTNTEGKTLTLETENMPSDIKPAKKRRADNADRLKALAMNSLKTPRGGEFHIFLEDSTEVWLNAESSLEYPDNFGGDNRTISVKGEAFFKVRKDNDRPFFVKTDGLVVRVYGTEFSVTSYPEETKVYTTLVEGEVGVLPSVESTSVLYLSPDHQVVYSKETAATEIKEVNSKLLTSWKDGLFVFEDQTLEQIMVQLGRWYDFNYRFGDEASKKIQFKGRIPRYGKFLDLIEILEKSGGILFTADNDCIVITKK